MIDNEKSYYGKRRFFFWQNFSRALDQLVQDFDANSAGKFVDDCDRASIEGVNVFLHSASLLALKRYHSVLGEFILQQEKGDDF